MTVDADDAAGLRAELANWGRWTARDTLTVLHE
jgi:hypothetical protein